MPLTNHDAALRAATAKLTPEDRKAIIAAFVQFTATSGLVMKVTADRKDGNSIVAALAAFSDPALIFGAAFALHGILGHTSQESSTVYSTIRTTFEELSRLVKESPDAAFASMEEIIAAYTRPLTT